MACLPFGVVEKPNGLYRGGEAYLSNAPSHPAGNASCIHSFIIKYMYMLSQIYVQRLEPRPLLPSCLLCTEVRRVISSKRWRQCTTFTTVAFTPRVNVPAPVLAMSHCPHPDKKFVRVEHCNKEVLQCQLNGCSAKNPRLLNGMIGLS